MIILEGKGPAQNNTDARAITQPNPSIDRTAEHHFAFGLLPDKVQHPTGESCLFNRPQRPERSIGQGEQHACFTATKSMLGLRPSLVELLLRSNRDAAVPTPATVSVDRRGNTAAASTTSPLQLPAELDLDREVQIASQLPLPDTPSTPILPPHSTHSTHSTPSSPSPSAPSTPSTPAPIHRVPTIALQESTPPAKQNPKHLVTPPTMPPVSKLPANLEFAQVQRHPPAAPHKLTRAASSSRKPNKMAPRKVNTMVRALEPVLQSCVVLSHADVPSMLQARFTPSRGT